MPLKIFRLWGLDTRYYDRGYRKPSKNFEKKFFISNPGEISLSEKIVSQRFFWYAAYIYNKITIKQDSSLGNQILLYRISFNENINKEDRRIYEGIPVYKIESADDNKIKIGFGSKPQSSPGKYISLSKFDTYAFRKFEDVRISLIRKAI